MSPEGRPAASDQACRACKFWITYFNRNEFMGRCNNHMSDFYGEELHRSDGCTKHEPVTP